VQSPAEASVLALIEAFAEIMNVAPGKTTAILAKAKAKLRE